MNLAQTLINAVPRYDNVAKGISERPCKRDYEAEIREQTQQKQRDEDFLAAVLKFSEDGGDIDSASLALLIGRLTLSSRDHGRAVSYLLTEAEKQSI